MAIEPKASEGPKVIWRSSRRRVRGHKLYARVAIEPKASEGSTKPRGRGAELRAPNDKLNFASRAQHTRFCFSPAARPTHPHCNTFAARLRRAQHSQYFCFSPAARPTYGTRNFASPSRDEPAAGRFDKQDSLLYGGQPMSVVFFFACGGQPDQIF